MMEVSLKLILPNLAGGVSNVLPPHADFLTNPNPLQQLPHLPCLSSCTVASVKGILILKSQMSRDEIELYARRAMAERTSDSHSSLCSTVSLNGSQHRPRSG